MDKEAIPKLIAKEPNLLAVNHVFFGPVVGDRKVEHECGHLKVEGYQLWDELAESESEEEDEVS